METWTSSTMLHELPTEISLYIASYLPIQCLRNISLVSRAWHSLITHNVQAVYHNTAILHNFVHHADLQADSSGQSPDAKKIDWLKLCLFSSKCSWYLLTISARSTTISDREGLAGQGSIHRERAELHRKIRAPDEGWPEGELRDDYPPHWWPLCVRLSYWSCTLGNSKYSDIPCPFTPSWIVPIN